MERVLAGWSGTGDVSVSLVTDDNIHAPSGRCGASRLPGTWLALQETTCWDRQVQWEPSCLAMLCKQMPPPAHANLHPPVPTAPALLGANTSGCRVPMPTEQNTHTHTRKPDTLILPENVPGQSVCLSSQRFLVTGMVRMVTFANKHQPPRILVKGR